MRGWERTTIGEVCTIVNGGTHKTGVPGYWGGTHCWITPAEMGKRVSPFVKETVRKLTDAGLCNSSAELLPPFSVILSSRAPIGHLVINTVPMATNQGCKGLVPGKKLTPKFLYHYLDSVVDILNELGTGATFKELSAGKLREVPILLPPLAEQQRIVEMLDEASASLESFKSTYSRKLALIDELKRSFMQKAFSGELTAGAEVAE